LPFIFIFNTQLLMIDIRSPAHFLVVVGCSIVAMGCFVAATQFWLIARNRWYETVALLLICFTLFRPGFWLDLLAAPYTVLPPAEITRVAANTPAGSTMRIKVASQNRAGDNVDKVLRIGIGEGTTLDERLRGSGLSVRQQGNTMQVIGVRFGSEAAKFGLTAGDTVEAVYTAADRPSQYWMTLPGFGLLAVLILLQLRRRRALTALTPAMQPS
jgi:hypothetical protein